MYLTDFNNLVNVAVERRVFGKLFHTAGAAI